MRLAISNIAWASRDSNRVYQVLTELGVRGLEIAPGNFFSSEPDPFCPSEQVLNTELAKTRSAGLALVSMQSLLFGVKGASLFGDASATAAFEVGINRAINLAGRLGIPNLVVGSPKNRVIPAGMDKSSAMDIAAKTFRRLGDAAELAGCVLAIEPNPSLYGTNFLNTVAETHQFVRDTNHPAVTLNFDVGAVIINGELDQCASLFETARREISHVHLSEPQLAALPQDKDRLGKLMVVIRQSGWDGWVSIEMRNEGRDSVAQVRRAVISCLNAMRHQ